MSCSTSRRTRGELPVSRRAPSFLRTRHAGDEPEEVIHHENENRHSRLSCRAGNAVAKPSPERLFSEQVCRDARSALAAGPQRREPAQCRCADCCIDLGESAGRNTCRNRHAGCAGQRSVCRPAGNASAAGQRRREPIQPCCVDRCVCSLAWIDSDASRRRRICTFFAPDSSAVHNVAKDFADDFAAHRNADRYLQSLKSGAKAVGGLSSEDFHADLGPYDFNRKSFSIVIGSRYKKAVSITNGSLFYDLAGVFPAISKMPDGSALAAGFDSYYVELYLGKGNRLSATYPLDPDRAEIFQKAVTSERTPLCALTERLVFYPVAISRRSNGLGIVAVVHVTKVVLEQRCPFNAPITAVPTILMSTDLQ